MSEFETFPEFLKFSTLFRFKVASKSSKLQHMGEDLRDEHTPLMDRAWETKQLQGLWKELLWELLPQVLV